MKLFRYKEYIKENTNYIKNFVDGLKKGYPNDIENLERLRNEFYSEIVENCDDVSYSNLASNSSRNPESDFEDVQSTMDNKGFTLEVLKLLFSKDVNKEIGDIKSFMRKYNLDSYNGLVDLYFYKLNEILNLGINVPLGGEGWSSYINNPDTEYPGYEVLMKYAYGYHKTNYGKLVLNQVGYKPEDFVEESFLQLKRYLISGLEFLYKTEGKFVDLYNVFEEEKFIEFLEKYIICEEDRLVFQIESFFDEVFDVYSDNIEDEDESYKNMKIELVYGIKQLISDISELSRSVKVEENIDNVIIS